MELFHHASASIGIIGVLVIILGVLSGLWRFLRSEMAAARGRDISFERKQLRSTLGYYLLLGLEFLIAADIIETLIKPTTEHLAVLGAVVAIRTVISFSLTAELSHEQKAAA